jgi:hypothetical protein
MARRAPDNTESVVIKTHFSLSFARRITTEHFTQALDWAAAAVRRSFVGCPPRDFLELRLRQISAQFDRVEELDL